MSKLLNKALGRHPSPDHTGSEDGQDMQATHALSLSLDDVLASAKRGQLASSTETLLEGLKQRLNSKEPINDRDLLFEHGIGMCQALPPGSPLAKQATEGLIASLLRGESLHSQQSSADPEALHRTCDGAKNNLTIPSLGQSGRPFAKDASSKAPKPVVLPDPELVFDLLMKRDVFKPHPAGFSTLFISFAMLLSAEAASPRLDEPHVNVTTGYLDLSTLYGKNEAEQRAIRLFDGSGSIHPDSIASAEVLLMPPSVAALVVLFARNHEHVVNRLFQINECGIYRPLASFGDNDVELRKQDDDLFNKARNINCAWFFKIVQQEFMRAVQNAYAANSLFAMDFTAEYKTQDGRPLPRGGGNVVGATSTIVHRRWHTALPDNEARSLIESYSQAPADRGSTQSSIQKLTSTFGALMKDASPTSWSLQGLSRGPDGRISDDDLSNILQIACEQPAGSFGARTTPVELKTFDIAVMRHAREMHLASYQEFREHLGLVKLSSFDQWSSDPQISKAAELLYGHIDALELVPGLAAEDCTPLGIGSAVCAPFTVGRAWLKDVVKLLRSDRFSTIDYGSATLTSWGLASLQPAPGSQGGLLANLFFTGLPFHFKYNQSQVLLPFYTPPSAKAICAKNKVDQCYSFEKATKASPITAITSFSGCKKAFSDQVNFGVSYNDWIRVITDGRGFLIGFDEHKDHDPPSAYMMSAFHQPNFEQETTAFFMRNITQQIQLCSISLPGSTDKLLDVVRDICNYSPIAWIAQRLAMPIKSTETPHGLFTMEQLRLMFVGLFVFSSFNIIPKAGFLLRETSIKSAAVICGIIKARILTSTGAKNAVAETLGKNTAFELDAEAEAFYVRLASIMQTGISADQLAGDTLGCVIPIAGNITQQSALLIDFYLDDARAQERAEIIRLSLEDTHEADAVLLKYIKEAMRFVPVVIGLPRVVKRDIVFEDGSRTLSLSAGDRVVLATSRCHQDPEAFKNPEKIDISREHAEALIMGHGLHYCFGARITWVSLVCILKSVFRLKGVRRAPGPNGHLSPIKEPLSDMEAHVFLDTYTSRESPAPVSLHIQYDSDGDNTVQAKGMTSETSAPQAKTLSKRDSIFKRVGSSMRRGSQNGD